MAEIELERKSGAGWLWIALALLALVLLVWWIWPDNEVETVVPVAPAVVDAPPRAVPTPGFVAGTINEILNSPEAWIGREFPTATVTVAEVPTDRGFWIEGDAGVRMLAIIIDGPVEQPLDINPGQTLQITGGTLRAPEFVTQLPGAPLDADTRALLAQQQIFLVVDEANIDITQAGNPQPGTTPAQTAP